MNYINYIEEYKNYLKIKDYSNIYTYYIKYYLKYLESNNINILSIDYNTISNYILYLKDSNYKNSYINARLKAVKSFYRFLYETKKIKKNTINILKKFKLLKVERRIKEYITLEELDNILDLILTLNKRIDIFKTKALLYFLIYTGLRKNELLNLKRKDINLDTRKAIIRTPTKNKEERIVLFPKRVVSILRIYFKSEPEETNAFNITYTQFIYLVDQLNKYLPKEKHISIHTFRHSFAMMLASSGIDVRVAQKLLGHKSLENTLIYYNPDIRIINKIYDEKIK